MEQFFVLHKKSNTQGTKKVKSLLETLKTWSRNAVTKQNSSKSSYLPENQKEFLKIFDQRHERTISFNVILALFKMRVIMYESAMSNNLSHNMPKVEQILRTINGMVDAGGATKE